MKTTYNWLARHLNDFTFDANLLTNRGIEVDKVYKPSPYLKELKIITVKHMEPHPTRPELNLVSFDDKVAICGDRSLKAGERCIVIVAGQVLPSTGKKLRPRSVDGIPSDCMLCSGDELGGPYTEGVLRVPAHIDNIEDAVFPNGAEYNIDITYNRSDLLSARGLARELAALGMGKLKPLLTCKPSFAEESSDIATCSGCDFYSLSYFNVMSDIKCSELQVNSLVESTGLPLVDIGNFVMHDMGQPVHIFDADKIRGKVHVRLSKEGEEFTDLHGKHSALPSDLLVIADDTGIIAVAGVIGGLSSAYSLDTKRIALEIAHFDPNMVLKSQLALNLNTQAANFFTHGVDVTQTDRALAEFCNLSGLEPITRIYSGSSSRPSRLVSFNNSFGEKLCCNWDEELFVDTLAKLGITRKDIQASSCPVSCDLIDNLGPASQKDSCSSEQSPDYIFSIPDYRLDIQSDYDLISEYIRLVGHGNTKKHLLMQNNVAKYIERIDLSHKYHQTKHLHLVANSYQIAVDNPMTGYAGLRSSLLGQLLNTAIENFGKNRQFTGLYEEGYIFGSSFAEADPKHGTVSGKQTRQHRHLAVISKETIDQLQQSLWLDNISYKTTHDERFKFCAHIIHKKQVVGIIGLLKHSLKTRVEFSAFEINLDLIKSKRDQSKYIDYHTTYERDFSVTTSKPASDLLKAIPYPAKIIASYPDHFMHNPRTLTIRCLINAKTTHTTQELQDITSKIQQALDKVS